MSYLVRTLAARLNLPEITVEMALPAFDVVTDEAAGDDVGALVIDGHEIHSCLRPGGITRCRLRAIWARVLERYGYLTTRVPAADTHQRRFVTRMGFRLQREDVGVAHYLIERAAHA